MKLLVATKNKGKLREIGEILDSTGITPVGMDEAGITAEIVEDGETFAINAAIKARALHAMTGLPVLADDSGLAVNALNGAPGVRSARYSGENATDEANWQKLLAEMAEVPEAKRGAAFVCAMVLVGPDGSEHSAEGKLEGSIAGAPKGDGGFGYDPVFLLNEGITLAEAGATLKNSISHRASALARILPAIKALAEEKRS